MPRNGQLQGLKGL